MKWLKTDLPTLDSSIQSAGRPQVLLAAAASIPLLLTLASWPLALLFVLIVSLAYWRGDQPILIRLAALLAAFTLLWVYRPGDQQGFFSAAILVLTAVKTLELRTLKDGQFLLNTTLFGLFSAALLVPTAWMSGLVFAGTAGLLIGHYLLLNPDDSFSLKRLLRLLRLVGKVSLLVLPLFVILFYAFPRIGGQFFSFGLMSGVTTGLTDELEPGALSQLALSETTRFRVEGEGVSTNLYYRVHVLEEFDGQTWRKSPNTPFEAVVGVPTEQVITIEMPAHNDTWLPLPEWSTTQTLNSAGATLESMDNLDSLWRAQFVLSEFVSRGRDLTNSDRARLLALGQSNPRMDEWLKPYQNSSLSEVLSALEQYFAANLLYSLTPPAADPISPVDVLMFDDRVGFCGHFSHATAYALRKLGFPARVVTGFQGGRLNQTGQYLQVRDADAHAWVEVHDGSYWQRVDPTTWVEPSRTEQGVESIESITLSRGGFGRQALVNLPRSERLVSLYSQMKDFMDQLQRGYTRWVVDFDSDSQTRLFESIKAGYQYALMLFSIALVWFYRRLIQRIWQDPWIVMFDMLARLRGQPRQKWQAPADTGLVCSRTFSDAWLDWRFGQGTLKQVKVGLKRFWSREE